MQIPPSFYRSMFDSNPEHIAVIDNTGAVRSVNASWTTFALTNGGNPTDWLQTNYLDICDRAADQGSSGSEVVATGIRQTISTNTSEFQHAYPCELVTGVEWYSMTVKPVQWDSSHLYCISHRNVTQATLTHQTLIAKSRTDSLTGLSNRRHFDELLSSEWRRDMRAATPISLIMLDIDLFKSLNDKHGHIVGDTCLQKIATLLKSFTQRPGDHAARYGGEEFALILGNTSEDAATKIARAVNASIRQLHLVDTPVTASLGVATTIPHRTQLASILLEAADKSLYVAKNRGRNQVAVYGK